MKYDVNGMSDKELMEAIKIEVANDHLYSVRQSVKKVQLNSLYGSLGNEYSRWYDLELAEAITLSGQLSIQWIADAINKLLNHILKTEKEDYVIASDTDSVYLRLGSVVQQSFKEECTPQSIVDFLNKFSDRVIQPCIEKEFASLSSQMNAYKNKMVMGREVIAEKGVWTAKKRYMLSVWDSEGVRYQLPKIKIMGIETARSSTPAFVRTALKKAVNMILCENELTLQQFVKEINKTFCSLPPEEVAFPRSVSKMKDYASSSTIYKKATPIAVKAALIHNHLSKKHKLDKKVKAIGEGEKMKFLYLKSPNPVRETVIGFTSSLPREFDVHKYIDYTMQFNKSFLEPLRTITTAIGWSPEHRSTLDSFFT